MNHNFHHERRGKYSSWGFSLTHLYFSLHFLHCNAWGGSRRGTCQSLPLIPWFPPACVLTSATCGTHQIIPTGKKISLKRVHIYRTSTPIRCSLLKWQLQSRDLSAAPHQVREWGFPAASASTTGHHNKNCCYRLNKQLCCLILWAMR